MRKILVMLAVLFMLACTQIQPANPRPTPHIEINVPKPLPDHPRYEPPPSDPNAQIPTFKTKIEATRNEFLPSEIKVQKGSYVSLDLLATEVPQRFTIQSLGIDEILPVGRDVTVEFMADHAGTIVFYNDETQGMQGKIIIQ